ncbi:MAG TPA: R3H domain-containing nucleic acid-binding protein [Candidatus Acidoferrales bacterium]|nr:R3H domain-containing nucleic acid-binding protein [Candidatus Acidoferrales bacterium]
MLYEDDFEFEEQPANIRDRAIPGKGPGGGGSGGGGGGDRRRRAGGNGGGRRYPGGNRTRGYGSRSAGQELPESAKPARDLLGEILERMGVGPIDIAYIPRPEGEYLEVSGPDLGMLIGRHGNTLEALNLVFNNILNAGVRNNRHYFTIDAEGYRARRADNLKNLALDTMERVLRDKSPQKLEPMLPSERKIVHLALADSENVRTESEGEEPERCVVIFPK